MAKIPSPANLNMSDSRALKTWLYQLWQAVGGTTTTAIDDIDVYMATPAADSINSSQLDQVLLTQIRDELSEINKKLDEILINERTVLDDVNKKLDELRINERSALDEVNKKIDDVVLLLGATL